MIDNDNYYHLLWGIDVLKDVTDLKEQMDSLSSLNLLYQFTEECKTLTTLNVEARAEGHAMFAFVMKHNVYVTLSSGGLKAEGKVVNGEFFYIPPKSMCSISCETSVPAHVAFIHFQLSAPNESDVIRDGQAQKLLKLVDAQVQGQQALHVHNWIPDFLKADTSMNLVSYYQVQSHLYALAASFLSYTAQPARLEDELNGYVRHIIHTMMVHYDTHMDMDEIVRLSGHSASRFYKVFKKYTSLSPHKLMTMVRLNKSLTLLGNAQLTIAEVAHAVGYSDELYFSRLFKKHMGLTPREYSKLAQKRIVLLSPVFQGDLAVLGLTPQITVPEDWVEEAEEILGQIAQLAPDLIFAGNVNEELVQKLESIAPTVVLDEEELAWRERLARVSAAVSLTSVAQRWVENYDVKVANARGHVKQHLGTQPFAVVGFYTNKFRVYGSQCLKIGDFFFDDLEITPAERVKEIGCLDLDALNEVAQLECSNVIFLVPDERNDAELVQLELAWHTLYQESRGTQCIFIKHPMPLLYHAEFYEQLIDLTVEQLMQNDKL